MQGDRKDTSPAKTAPPSVMSKIKSRAVSFPRASFWSPTAFGSMRRLRAALRLAVVLLASPMAALADEAASEAHLVMVEQRGCIYCIRWMEDIGDAYPLTPEGRAAPLMRVDIADGAPDGMAFDRRVVFTPTFILMVDGAEAARLEGYPGEDFFWGLLGRMLDENGIDFAAAGAP